MREKDVLRQVLDYLSAKHIFSFRLSTGVFFDSKRCFRAHGLGRGAADILALPENRVIWLEIKGPKGRQRPEQKTFEAWVRSCGHLYLLVHSVDDLEGIL